MTNQTIPHHQTVLIAYGSSIEGASHSYSGWVDYTYMRHDGVLYVDRVGQGVFGADNGYGPAEKLGLWDKLKEDYADRVWSEVDGLKASSALQDAAGIEMKVPAGEVVVMLRSGGMLGGTYAECWGSAQQSKNGGKIAPTRYRQAEKYGRVLRVGDSLKFVEVSTWSKEDGRRIIKNIGGQAVIEQDPAVKADQHNFAQEQISMLILSGYSKEKAWKILKAGGPGAVKNALAWVVAMDSKPGAVVLAALHGCRKWHKNQKADAIRLAGNPSQHSDAYSSMLYGTGGKNGFGMDRIEGAFVVMGLACPNHRNSRHLHAILRACIAMIPLPDSLINPEWVEEKVSKHRTEPDYNIPVEYQTVFTNSAMEDALKGA
ncbi:MAG: hypothetical protein GXP14_07355 [Gammaproteobacteria bacterium]|nr:hypothetical protein [Gammaproteobacteria bacterium]